jgi:hypothetical protein
MCPARRCADLPVLCPKTIFKDIKMHKIITFDKIVDVENWSKGGRYLT